MRRMAAIVVLSALGVLGTAVPGQAAARTFQPRCWTSTTTGVALGYTVTETTRTCWTRHHGFRTHVHQTFLENVQY